MRRPHLLRGLKRSEMPSHLIFIDTETNELRLDDTTVEAVLNFGWACYTRRHHNTVWSAPVWQRFASPEEFWAWCVSILPDKSRLYIFAHNQSFDFTVLKGFEQLPLLGYALKSAIIEGPPTILTYKNGGRSIVILDTLNYFRCSLAMLGADLGYPKLRMPTKTSSAARWDAYCRRDVKVILRAMMQFLAFIHVNDLGNFKPTLASQSFSAYRHRFMHREVYIDDHSDALSLARFAYHGGRVECSQLGKITGPLYQLDINSQYPFVMREHPMPTRLLNYTTRATSHELKQWIQNKQIVAEVTVKTDDPAYPIRHNNRLVFPIGRFRCALTTPEIEYALNRNHIVAVHQVALYRSDHIFTEFVDYFYNARQQFKIQNNKAYELMTKILLNSLYGKFGQSGKVYKETVHTDDLSIAAWVEIDADTGKVYQWRQFGGVVQLRSTEGESLESHPAIAAHVTAYARVYLWSLIHIAERDNVYYYDTDSLLVNRAGLANLASYITPNKLGALKIVNSYDNVELFGAKDYRMGDRVTLKGVRHNAVQVSPSVFVQDKFSNFKGMLARGELNHMRISRITKNLNRRYNKGIVGIHGLITPFIIND